MLAGSSDLDATRVGSPPAWTRSLSTARASTGVWPLDFGNWWMGYLDADEPIFSLEGLCSFSIADEGDSVVEVVL